MYKYLITTEEGWKLYKADPFANYAEMRPGNASKVTNLKGFGLPPKNALPAFYKYRNACPVQINTGLPP